MTVVHGQAIGTPRIAGRVNALAVEPVNGERIYAASGNGGLWYSGDSGTTWSALGGFAPTVTADINRPIQRHSCGAVGVAFGATIDGDEVFVGTGEPWNINDAEPGSSLHGIGILVASGPGKLTSVNPFSREAKNLIGAAVSRFAMEPGGSTVVAATTIGLLQRPDPAGPDEDWQRVAGAPFKNLTDECTDVLWTAAAGATPERLWVWVRRGDSAGLWVRDAGTTDFVKIATPGALAKRAALGAATPPTTVYVFNDQGNTSLPALFRVASGAGKPVASFVFGVPDVLKKQGSYDIAIAVDPSNAKNVVLGGCTFDTVTADGTLLEDDGAIVLGDVDMAGARKLDPRVERFHDDRCRRALRRP